LGQWTPVGGCVNFKDVSAQAYHDRYWTYEGGRSRVYAWAERRLPKQLGRRVYSVATKLA
jgi:hypothetical protein